MRHYYCESCSGVDTMQHECRTEGCPKINQPLTEHNTDDFVEHKAAHEKWLVDHQTE